MKNGEKGSFQDHMGPFITEGFIRCKDLLSAAGSAGITGEEARKHADNGNIKIMQCQLGLFGWEEDTDTTPAEITGDIKDCLHSAAADMTITCPALWKCASSCGVSRREIGAAADALGYKIRGCQLGIF